MIELIKLSVQYSTEEEAKKLSPYLKKADVCGPENSYRRIKWARQREKQWEEWIDESASTDLQKKLEEWEFGTHEYTRKEFEIIERQRIPLWFLERWSYHKKGNPPLKQKERLERAIEMLQYSSTATDFEAQYLRDLKEYFEAQKDSLIVRDQHIAKNLEGAEQALRERYPQLTEKEKITYPFILGSAHEPERYTDTPITVVDLTDQQKQSAMYRLFLTYREGTPFEALEEDLIKAKREEDKKKKLAKR